MSIGTIGSSFQVPNPIQSGAYQDPLLTFINNNPLAGILGGLLLAPVFGKRAILAGLGAAGQTASLDQALLGNAALEGELRTFIPQQQQTFSGLWGGLGGDVLNQFNQGAQNLLGQPGALPQFQMPDTQAATQQASDPAKTLGINYTGLTDAGWWARAADWARRHPGQLLDESQVAQHGPPPPQFAQLLQRQVQIKQDRGLLPKQDQRMASQTPPAGAAAQQAATQPSGAVSPTGNPADVSGGIAPWMQNIFGGFLGRLNTGMDIVNRLGEQQRADIQRDYRNLAGKAGQDMVARGLSGTTVAPTVQAGIEREKQADLRRLNDLLNREKYGLFSQLSGDALRSMVNLGSGLYFPTQQNLLTAGTNLSSSLGGMPITSAENWATNFLNAISGITNAYPSANAFQALMTNLGQSAAPPPQAPSAFETILGPAVGGLLGGVGSGLGFAKGLGLTCVSGATVVLTSTGAKPLRKVHAGDSVLTPDGFRVVTARDYGQPKDGPERFVELRHASGKLSVTLNHHLLVRRKNMPRTEVAEAGSLVPGDLLWDQNGEQVPILAVTHLGPRAIACGDLEIEHGTVAEYCAGGVFIRSMMAGVEKNANRL